MMCKPEVERKENVAAGSTEEHPEYLFVLCDRSRANRTRFTRLPSDIYFFFSLFISRASLSRGRTLQKV